RQQVDALVAKLNQLGLGRGDRIAMALPNGLEMIAAFLAASTVGTAAPLNPAYRVDEFRFYLEDTGARALIVPPTGSDEARQAAGDQTLIIEAELDGSGQVQFSSAGTAGPPRARDYPRPQRGGDLPSHRSGCFVVRDAAVSRPRPCRLDAGHVAHGRNGRCPAAL